MKGCGGGAAGSCREGKARASSECSSSSAQGSSITGTSPPASCDSPSAVSDQLQQRRGKGQTMKSQGEVRAVQWRGVKRCRKSERLMLLHTWFPDQIFRRKNSPQNYPRGLVGARPLSCPGSPSPAHHCFAAAEQAATALYARGPSVPLEPAFRFACPVLAAR